MSDLLAVLVEAASENSGVPVAEIYGFGRQSAPVAARHTVWLVLSEEGWTALRIASAFGRDHSTISNGMARASLRARVNVGDRALLDELRRMTRHRFDGGGVEQRAAASLFAMDQEIAIAQALVEEITGKVARLRALRQQVVAQLAEFTTPTTIVRARRTVVA